MEQTFKPDVEKELIAAINLCKTKDISPKELKNTSPELYERIAILAEKYFTYVISASKNISILHSLNIDIQEVIDDSVMKLLKYYNRINSIGYIISIANSCISDRIRYEIHFHDSISSENIEDIISSNQITLLDIFAYENWIQQLNTYKLLDSHKLLSTAVTLSSQSLWAFLGISALGFKPKLLANEIIEKGLLATCNLLVRYTVAEYHVSSFLFTSALSRITDINYALDNPQRLASQLSQLNIRAVEQILKKLSTDQK